MSRPTDKNPPNRSRDPGLRELLEQSIEAHDRLTAQAEWRARVEARRRQKLGGELDDRPKGSLMIEPRREGEARGGPGFHCGMPYLATRIAYALIILLVVVTILLAYELFRAMGW